MMKTLIFVASATALALAPPAMAKPGHGHGGQAQAQDWHGNARPSREQASRGQAGREHGRHVATSRNGRGLYALDARGSCPPGLAKKHNGCMAPGQARKLYGVGQHYNRNYGYQWTYNRIPVDLRSRYNLDSNDRYYYRDGYVYQVDPRTMLVQQVVSALVR
jgi:hypothetical protein